MINRDLRLRLSQENKEIINILLKQGYSLEDFRYCKVLGFIESAIMKRECESWKVGK
jgi:hypothetical protein